MHMIISRDNNSRTDCTYGIQKKSVVRNVMEKLISFIQGNYKVSTVILPTFEVQIKGEPIAYMAFSSNRWQSKLDYFALCS